MDKGETNGRSSKLCSICLSMVLFVGDTLEPLDHHSSIERLFQVAAAGCPICRFVTAYHFSFTNDEELNNYYPERSRNTTSLWWQKSGPRYTLYTDQQPQRTKANKNIDDTQPSSPTARGHLRILGSFGIEPMNDEGALERSERSSSTDSKQSWQLAFNWIHQCIDSHRECRQKGSFNFVPNRLLDVGLLQKPMLRLQLGNQITPQSPYVTLSHCWGKLLIKRLVTANLNLLCEKIEVNELPKTFQDAIRFTRAFGVRYIWIDSLCIIQDSITDWQKESAVMGDIYKNALYNIAATAAPDGSFGCFFERDPFMAQACLTEVDILSAINSASSRRIFRVLPTAMFIHEVQNAPLNRRAWVLQEKFLSPRVLHCGRNQLLWECKMLRASESFPSGLPLSLYYRHRTKSLNDGINPLAALITWTDLLSAYTMSSLTEDRDRLVAISAIARELQLSIGGRYLAGLWENFLPIQLLWEVFPSSLHRVPRRVRTYCAPTWSWASLIGSINNKTRVNYHATITPREECMIDILDCTIQPITSDLLGQVSEGCLKIRGWLRTFGHIKVYEHDILQWYLKVQNRTVGIVSLDVPETPWHKTLHFLPVLERTDWESVRKICGLVLLSTGITGQYRRVGLLTSDVKVSLLFKPHNLRVSKSLGLVSTQIAKDPSKLEVNESFQERGHNSQDEVKSGEGRVRGSKRGTSAESNEDIDQDDQDEWVETVLEII